MAAPSGKSMRKQEKEQLQNFVGQIQADVTENKCPLCGRPFGGKIERHHLIPDCRGGKETEKIHKICHRKIHATFSEKELEKYYHTVDRLLEHEEMRKFVDWVSKKEPDYYDSSVESKERKRKRGR